MKIKCLFLSFLFFFIVLLSCSASETTNTKESNKPDKSISFNKHTKFKNFAGMEFVYIEAGKFTMGSSESPKALAKTFGGEEDYYKAEKPHGVYLTKNFYLQTKEVTKEQFEKFVEDTGYKTDAEKNDGAFLWDGSEWKKDSNYYWKNPGFEQDDDHPAVCISWNDAVEFCKWLTKNDKDGRKYRLPTESEWEYACKAGKTTNYCWGDDPDKGKGWCNAGDLTAKEDNPNWTTFDWKDGYIYTSPVASFKANGWGLYDMHGNVFEWCQDWHGEYPSDEIKDPKGPEKGKYRVQRGGSWYSNPRNCRSANRFGNSPGDAYTDSGFRVLCEK
jgi:formylglycine-generating enzyme